MRRTLLALTIVGALSGCGGEVAGQLEEERERGLSDPGEIRAVAREYVQALTFDDEDRICQLLTPERLEEIGSPTSCLFRLDENELPESSTARSKRLLAPNGAIQEIAELEWDGGSRATVYMKRGEREIKLREVDGAWLVDGP